MIEVAPDRLMDYAKAGALGTKAPPLSNASEAHALASAARAQNCLVTVAQPLRSDPCCPPELANELDGIETRSWAIHIMTAAAIGPVLAKAAAKRITLVVYKGAAQAARYYAHPSRRSMGDVDVLVDESQKNELYEIVAALGFQMLVTPGRAVSSRQSHERSYAAPTPGTRVLDIHTSPAPPTRYRLPIPEMIARSTAGTLFDAPVRFLAPEDELLVMAANQAYDHFRLGFVRYLDAWLIAQRCLLLWRFLAELAIEAGCANATWLSLSNASRVTGLKVPEEVMELMRPSSIRRAWLGALLDRQGIGAPRFALPRRLEQGLLVYPVIDRPAGFLRFLATHAAWRILDVADEVKHGVRQSARSGR